MVVRERSRVPSTDIFVPCSRMHGERNGLSVHQLDMTLAALLSTANYFILPGLLNTTYFNLLTC